MSEGGKELIGALKTFAGLFGLFSGLFAASGLLAVRAYLGGLGVPPVASLSLDNYIQQGGRFFFTLTIHLLLVLLPLYISYLLISFVWRFFSKSNNQLRCAVLNVVGISLASLVGILFLLDLLDRGPIFVPGHKLGTPRLQIDCFTLLVVEGIAVGAAGWLYGTWENLRSNLNDYRWAQPVPFFVAIIVLALVMLVPIAFGRIAMIPKTFEKVKIDHQKSSVSTTGLLVFSGKENYFIWDNTNLQFIQISNNSVQVVTYLAPNDLVGKEKSGGQ